MHDLHGITRPAQREGCFSEERSRLYAAMLILGIENLHAQKVPPLLLLVFM